MRAWITEVGRLRHGARIMNTPTPTWHDCLAAGMTGGQAAKARGVSRQAASLWAKRNSVEFAAADRSEARKKAWADPEVRARMSEAAKKALADPTHNPLAALTPSERQDYDALRYKGGLSRNEALRAIHRTDLGRGDDK